MSRVPASLRLSITSGAVTANIGYPAGVTFTNPPAAQPLPALATGDELQVTLAGLTVPELQKAGLSASTDVVTVGIGGNDLGFSHIAEACIRTGVDPTSEPVYLALELGISVPNCADYFGDPTTYPTADLFTRMTDAVAPRIDGVLDAIADLAEFVTPGERLGGSRGQHGHHPDSTQPRICAAEFQENTRHMITRHILEGR